jgi:hypothetical protein
LFVIMSEAKNLPVCNLRHNSSEVDLHLQAF